MTFRNTGNFSPRLHTIIIFLCNTRRIYIYIYISDERSNFTEFKASREEWPLEKNRVMSNVFSIEYLFTIYFKSFYDNSYLRREQFFRENREYWVTIEYMSVSRKTYYFNIAPTAGHTISSCSICMLDDCANIYIPRISAPSYAQVHIWRGLTQHISCNKLLSYNYYIIIIII